MPAPTLSISLNPTRSSFSLSFFFFYSSSKSLRPRSSNPPTLNTNFKCTFPRFLFLRMKIKNKYSWIERIPSSLEAGVHAKGRIRCPKKCWREYRLHFGFVPMKNWIGTLHLPVNNSRVKRSKEKFCSTRRINLKMIKLNVEIIGRIGGRQGSVRFVGSENIPAIMPQSLASPGLASRASNGEFEYPHSDIGSSASLERRIDKRRQGNEALCTHTWLVKQAIWWFRGGSLQELAISLVFSPLFFFFPSFVFLFFFFSRLFRGECFVFIRPFSLREISNQIERGNRTRDWLREKFENYEFLR